MERLLHELWNGVAGAGDGRCCTLPFSEASGVRSTMVTRYHRPQKYVIGLSCYVNPDDRVDNDGD